MMDKTQIENFLKANGVTHTAKEEEIRSVLLSASFNNNEVDTALLILRKNIKNKETHVDTLHKVFHSDDRLEPVEINSLLGITVNFTNGDINDIIQNRRKFNTPSILTVVFLSVLIVLVGLVFMIHQNKVGPFYETSILSETK